MGNEVKSTFLGNINREFEEREVSERAKKEGLGYVNLEKFAVDIDVLKIVQEPEARVAEVFPLSQVGKKLRVAVVDPDNTETKTLLEKLNSKWKTEIFLCSPSSLAYALGHYDTDLFRKRKVERSVEISEDNTTNVITKIKNFGELAQKISSMHAETALSEIEITAVDADASDIHVQPKEQGAVLRFRIDGILHDIFSLDNETTKKLLNRIKYEAGMRSNISDVPQDGHSNFDMNGRKIDVRISTLPTPFGESVVMRLLDSQRGIKDFTELGFSEYVRDKMLTALTNRNGLILVTGPTGSGKTTTLYSMLSELNSSQRKLVTLEDPIEYELPGISQSQVNEKKEYNFETGLQALLRHDPDIMLVGEIRSFQTAKLSAEAALTGHVVLSSLHTNSAIGAISRLRNLGLENFNIAPTIVAVFAQRLVRKVCPHCVQRVDIPKDPKIRTAIQRLEEKIPGISASTTVPKSVGCEKCSQTGYMGRIAVCEAFLMTDSIRKIILEGKSEMEIKDFLINKTDFVTLFEDGLMKVLKGQTTLEELYRIVS
ncbi:GspE/PulE family protein [Candidatus Gracilibacteria bacterium]|nr:GspE/PulE family protein [Candidatus Gracilibacteria bacterium]